MVGSNNTATPIQHLFSREIGILYSCMAYVKLFDFADNLTLVFSEVYKLHGPSL